MSRKIIRALGLALALSVSTEAGVAFAAEPIASEVAVNGNPDALPPGALPEAAAPRDTHPWSISQTEYQQRYGARDPDGKYYASLVRNNEDYCAIAGTFMARAEELSARFRQHDVRYAQLYTRVEHLKRDRVVGTWLRRLGEAVGIGFAASISGPYAGVVAGPLAGSEIAATGNDRSQDANRELTLEHIEVTRDNIASNLLTLDMDMYWASLATPWCARVHPNAGIPHG